MLFLHPRSWAEVGLDTHGHLGPRSGPSGRLGRRHTARARPRDRVSSRLLRCGLQEASPALAQLAAQHEARSQPSASEQPSGEDGEWV